MLYDAVILALLYSLYNIGYTTLKDASHGHWYYNGDEFGGIFKG